MDQSTFPFKIEPMTTADIPAAVALDQAAYAANFALRSYKDELEHNRLAYYFALRPAISRPGTSLPSVIGLGGFWMVSEELHVTTLAIQPRYQGLGLGEWLLLSLIEEGLKLGAEVATLEVRPSNKAALALYQKYQFQEAGLRRGYYHNNGEDALIMTTPSLRADPYEAFLAQRKAQLLDRLSGIKVDKIA